MNFTMKVTMNKETSVFLENIENLHFVLFRKTKRKKLVCETYLVTLVISIDSVLSSYCLVCMVCTVLFNYDC